MNQGDAGWALLVSEVPGSRTEGSERMINELGTALATAGQVEVLRVPVTRWKRWSAPWSHVPEPSRSVRLVHFFPVGSLTRAALARGWLWRRRHPGSLLALHAFQCPVRGAPSRTELHAALGRGGAVITPSARLAAELEGRGVRTLRLPPGVDQGEFRLASPDERDAARRRFGIDQSERVVLHVGHVRPDRNLSPLLEMRRHGLSVLMVVSPRYPRDPAVEAALRQAGVRLVTEPLPHVREAYWAADCYCFPVVASHAAVAVPLSVLEALACGVPVVSVRFDGLLAELGESWPGVTWAESAGLAETVRRVFAQPRPSAETLAAAVSQRFGLATVADRYLQAYRSLVSDAA